MFLKVCSNMQGSSGRGVVVGGQALSGLMKVAIFAPKKEAARAFPVRLRGRFDA